MRIPFLSKKSSKTGLGIDLGTSSIKIVELTQENEGQIKLTNYAQFYASTDYIVKSRSGSLRVVDDQVIEILKQMFETASLTPREASIALPVFSSFSMLVDLPEVSEDELDSQVVEYEARKFIPLPMEEVQFDYKKIEHLSTPDNLKLLTVAVPNEIIEKYQKIASALNISIQNMELDTFSTARALVRSQVDAVLILDLGARNTNAAIMDGGQVVMHYNIDKGGNHFTQILARGLSISEDRADELKRSEGLTNSGNQVAELLKPQIDKIITEAEAMIEDYTKEGGKRPVRIVLTGGGAQMPRMANYIKNTMNISTEIGDPFQFILTPFELDPILRERGEEFTTAIGLAMRAFLQ